MRFSLLLVVSIFLGCPVDSTSGVATPVIENNPINQDVGADTADTSMDVGTSPAPETKISKPECLAAEDCADAADCTVDTCLGGECKHLPNAKWCDDSSACTIDTCNAAGNFQGGCEHKSAPCDDSNVCTLDTCSDPIKGCEHASDATACSDNNACTDDFCQPGGGCAYIPAVCDDGQLNTVDGCTPAAGCYHTMIECDIGSPCPQVDPCQVVACQFGVCVGQPKTCSDGLDCTFDTCQGGACTFIPFPNSCPADGNACTDEVCGPLGCMVVPVECNDDKPYTDDFCDPVLGCQSHVIDGWCENANQCEAGQPCEIAVCMPDNTCKYVAKDCNDGISCTVDKCDANGFCYSQPDDGLCPGAQKCNPYIKGCAECAGYEECKDANECTLDSCEEGACQHKPSVCYTEDAVCDPKTGYCQLPPDFCNHDWECSNSGDNCLVGKFVDSTCTTIPDSCNDDNPCTLDTCTPDIGCHHEWQKCDDGNKCTSDGCDSEVGCTHTKSDSLCIDCNSDTDCPAILTCEGLKDVQYTGVCKFWGCEHSAKFCSGSACYEAGCKEDLGCIFTPKCTDDDPCTNDICSTDGTCTFELITWCKP